MAIDELTCRELVELVTDYFEGALPVDEHERFEAHVARCEGCAAHLDQLRATIRVLRALPKERTLPVPDELLAAFRGWKRRVAS